MTVTVTWTIGDGLHERSGKIPSQVRLVLFPDFSWIDPDLVHETWRRLIVEHERDLDLGVTWHGLVDRGT